jgi:hypothetical protein
MKRILIFLSIFIGVALLIFALIFGVNRNAFKTLFENREGLAEGSEWVEQTYSLRGLTQYIDQNPERVSVASVVLGHPDSVIYYMADEPRTMGTLANIFLLIAYADAFENGTQRTYDEVSWSDISRYQLPKVDEAKHKEAKKWAEKNGYLSGDETIILDDLITVMVEFSDLSIADYLWFRIGGAEAFNELFEQIGMEYTDIPLPYSGLYLSISPLIRDMEFTELMSHLSDTESAERIEQVIAMAERYSTGNESREEWIEILESDRLGITFMQERDAMTFFPKTTAREFAGLSSSLIQGDVISEDVSLRVTNWMRWPMAQAAINRDFSDYGALYDNRIGLLNGIDFGTSVFTDDTTIQAVFFDDLQIAFWIHMSSNHMHQDFQQRLIWDPAMITAMNRIVIRQQNP